jgi:hypothetical protein
MPSPYNLGFTASSLGAAHTYALAAVYMRLGDWNLAKQAAVSGNVFQQVKATSITRLEREFRLRLQTLTESQLRLLVESPEIARIPLALLAVIKRYSLIRDFAEQVLIEKVQTLDFELRRSDYVSFIEEQEPAHPELNRLSESTAQKLKQVTIRILTEGEILSQSTPKRITPPRLPESVISVIESESPALLRPFLQL